MRNLPIAAFQIDSGKFTRIFRQNSEQILIMQKFEWFARSPIAHLATDQGANRGADRSARGADGCAERRADDRADRGADQGGVYILRRMFLFKFSVRPRMM